MMGSYLPESLAANNYVICNGDSLKIGLDSLPASFIAGNQNLTVKWNGNVFPDYRINRFVKPNVNMSYILELTKGSNIYKDTFNITVRPKPTIPSRAGDTTLVFGDLLKLDLNPQKLAGVNYKWDKGYLDSVLLIHPTRDTVCMITVLNEYGCSVNKNINIKVKYPIYITVNDTLKFRFPQLLNGYIRIGHSGLDSLFRKHRVISVQKVKYKLNHNGRLSREFRIVFNGNEDSLLSALSNFDSLITFKQISKPVIMHNLGSHAPGTYPNDWALGSTPPHALAAMRMPEAWAVTHGTTGMKVGIVELGSYPNIYHEDLALKVSIHTTCGIPYNPGQHATRVAGCIAAITNNGMGVAGAGYNIGVTAYSVPYSVGPLQFDEVLYAAWADGIRIVSLSFSGGGNDARIQEVIDKYYALGVLIIASAGNGDNGIRNTLEYPSSYNHVLSVSGAATADVTPAIFNPDMAPDPIFSQTNPDAYQVNFNNIVHGPTGHQYNAAVDICAPSRKVATTGGNNDLLILNNEYTDAWGTSYSSPLVAAVAALLVSVNPCLEPGQIEEIIKSTARPIADNTSANPWFNKLGAGFIDAKAAVDKAANYYGSTALVVNVNQTLNLTQVTRSYANIVVHAGAVLEITDCEIFMYPGSQILVKKGGRLIVVRSVLTMNYKPGLCNTTSDWVGIVIEGDPTKNQGSFADHGIANLVKTTIKYAKTCVSAGTSVAAGGGVILATDCDFTFRNCGIYFMPYKSPSGYNNTSVIDRCKFTIPFKYPSILLPFTSMTQTGINVGGVKGLKINGCDFRGDDMNGFLMLPTTYDRQAIGVNSYNSSLTVQDDKAITFPPKRQTIGTFKWLDKGIYHVSISANDNIIVNNIQFKTCGAGIKLNGGLISKIYRNRFDLFMNESDPCSLYYKQVGISAYNNIGLIISENNTFQTNSYYPNGISRCHLEKNMVGSVVNNTANPGKLASIYSYNNLNFGMVSSQFEVDNSNTAVRCNTYYKHFDAVAVYGINPDFGDCNAADNRKDRLNNFNNPYVYGDVCNFNSTGNSFDYLLTNYIDDPNPPTIVSYIVPSITVNLIRYCQSGAIGKVDCVKRDAPTETGPGSEVLGDGGKLPGLFEQLKLKKQLLANGTSNALEQSVILGNSSTATDVYNSLVLKSPYLSDAILTAVLNYGSYLNSTQIADILSLNSALSAILYQAALNNSQLQSDNNAMQTVTEAQSNINQRMVLESEINTVRNNYYEARTVYMDSMLYQHVEDTINNTNNYHLNKLITFFENQVDEENKYILFPLYCSTNNISKISSEGGKFSNSNTEEKAFKDVVLFNYDVLKGLADSTYLANNRNRIIEIATDTTLFASPSANGILDMVYKEVRYRDPFSHPTSEMGKRAMAIYELNKETTSMFTVFPNPTDGKINITLSNSLNIGKGTLMKIIDIEGNEVMESRFDKDHKNKVVYLQAVRNGIYFVKIILTDGRTYSEKLIYVK
ncbi:MAG: S8 family peptidase [Bacteroidia bacterium]|nr:S8 family peptidase [Bacteroidia bacterium]